MSGENVGVCPNCNAVFVPGMRFCRKCGFRLGEGVEEYAETRRFDNTVPHAAPPKSGHVPFGIPNQWAPPRAPMANLMSMGETGATSLGKMATAFHPKRANWVVWMVLAFVLMAVAGGVIRQFRGPRVFGPPPPPPPPRAMLGVSDLDTADDGAGAVIESLDEVPGLPADVAGLIGGDVITELNGRRIGDEDDVRDFLSQTRPGEPIEVTYVRDGEVRKTTLAAISSEEYRRLRAGIRGREGGFLGISPGSLSLSDVPGANFKGVRLGSVHKNRPAYIAGLRDGDVVIEFDGKPIRTEKDLLRRIDHAEPDSTVPIIVMRGAERLEIPVKLGRD